MKRVPDKGLRCSATSISVPALGRCVCGRGAEVQGQSRQIQGVTVSRETNRRASVPARLLGILTAWERKLYRNAPREKPIDARVVPRQQPKHMNTAAVAGKDHHSLSAASTTSRRTTVEGNPPRTDISRAVSPSVQHFPTNEEAITRGREDFVLPLLKDGEASPKK